MGLDTSEGVTSRDGYLTAVHRGVGRVMARL